MGLRMYRRSLCICALFLCVASSLALASAGDGTGAASVSATKVLAGSAVDLEFTVTGDGSTTLADFAVVVPVGWDWTGSSQDVVLSGPGCPGGKSVVVPTSGSAGPFYYISVGRDAGPACAITRDSPARLLLRNLVAPPVPIPSSDQAARFPVFTWNVQSDDDEDYPVQQLPSVGTVLPARIDLSVSPAAPKPGSSAVVTAKVLDDDNQSIPNVGVLLNTTSGTFDAATGLTDENGELKVLWHTASGASLVVLNCSTNSALSASRANFSIFTVLPVQLSLEGSEGPATLPSPKPLRGESSLPSAVPPQAAPQADLTVQLLAAAALVLLVGLGYYFFVLRKH